MAKRRSSTPVCVKCHRTWMMGCRCAAGAGKGFVLGRPLVFTNGWREAGMPYLPGTCHLHPSGEGCRCRH